MEEKVWRREIKTYEENVDEENVDARRATLGVYEVDGKARLAFIW